MCIAANAAVRAEKPGRAGRKPWQARTARRLRRFDVDAADEVRVNLPAGTVNAVVVAVPEVHFQFQLIAALRVVN